MALTSDQKLASAIGALTGAFFVAAAGVAYNQADKQFANCEEGQAAMDKITQKIDLRNESAFEKADATMKATFVAKNGQLCEIKSMTLYKNAGPK